MFSYLTLHMSCVVFQTININRSTENIRDDDTKQRQSTPAFILLL